MSEQDIDNEVNQTEDNSEPDYLSMSAEEFANAKLDTETKVEKEEVVTTEDANQDNDNANTDSNTETETSETEETQTESTESKTTESVNWEELYQSALAPFKASGKEIKVDTIEDLRTLAQMGVDYQKKMVAIKPLRKIGKVLEQNGLLDENQLNYLIDLKNKQPEAVKRFIQESGINPLELDMEEKVEYKPTNYSVDEHVIELDEVINNIQHTPKFAQTADIISKQWDSKSRDIIAKTPQLIATINEHVHNGVFDQIDSILQREKTLGKLAGMSDIDAYKAIGEWMQSNNMFEHQKVKPVEPIKVEAPKQEIKQQNIPDKKAASIPKQTSAKSSKVDISTLDILNMSEEEFKKLDKKLFK